MEGAFGADFSDVRVHTGDRAARTNQALGALAFTTGNDIVLGGLQRDQNDIGAVEAGEEIFIRRALDIDEDDLALVLALKGKFVDLVRVKAALRLKPVGPDVHLLRHRNPAHRVCAAVGIDQENVISRVGGRPGQGADERGLSGPALRVGNGDDHWRSFRLRINYS